MSNTEETTSATLINNLDFGDPLYLRASFIDGTCERSSYEDDEVLLGQWDRCNAVVLTWILTSISDELYLGQIFSDNASPVWQELKETYDRIDGSVTLNLHHKFNSLTQGQSSLSEYYHKVNCLWKQYDALIKLPTYTCEANKDFQSHNKLIKLVQFLMGLNDVYQPIRSNILTRDPLSDVKVAYAILSREESHRIGITNDFSKISQTSTFMTKSGNNTNSNSGSKRVTRGPNPNLYKKKPFNQFAPKFVANNNNSVSGKSPCSNSDKTGLPFSEEQIQKIISLISKDNEPSTSEANANMVGWFYNCNALFNENFQKFFCSNLNSKSLTHVKDWIIDSGANQHMVCSEENLFDKVDVTKFNITVGHPNGTKAKIGKFGKYKLNNHITLNNVLLIPEYCVNLLSVNILTKEDNLFVGFDKNRCYLQDLKENKTLGIGDESGGLYLFKRGDQTLNNNVIGNNVSARLWHHRLGHPAHQVLDVLKPNLKFKDNEINNPCDVCHRAKQKREPFPLSDHKTTKLGELIHLDLLPTAVLAGKPPFECIFFFKPSLSHIRVFGCLCYGTVLNSNDKFSNRAEKYVLIGYSSVKNGNKLFNLDQKTNPKSPNDEGRDTDNSDGTDNSHVNENNQSATPDESNDIPEGTNKNLQNSLNTQNVGETSTVRRSERAVVLPKRFSDFVIESKIKYGVEKVVNYSFLNDDNFCFVSNLNKSIKPHTYNEAVKDNNWVNAMNEEITALNRNNTWEMVDLPPGRKPIRTKWVYKIKYKSNEEIERYKARLVVKGFSQREGIDYEETFSPVVKMVTLRCLIALAMNKGWVLHQLDANNAFLYGYSLYIKLEKDLFLAILVYVDDIIITGNNESEIKQFKTYLSSKFKIKDLGKLKYFLGIEVLNYKDGVCLNQRKYCLELLQDFDWAKSIHLRKSSAESEYKCMSNAATEIMWILKLLDDLHIKTNLPVALFCDNKSAIQIVANPVFHEKTKHLEVDVHFIRKKVSSGMIKTVKIDSNVQLANILTKGLNAKTQIFL
ncbi:uncharacterized protein [Rutidosis leptorrhynchoides]|uniref:uncharacterized protein n=1 Tax=Rutidosis leptorrhynchoides TaxID=125765 RepID=UPI003A99DBEE